MQPEDKYFQSLTQPELWRRYCGFLDLTVTEFMAVQEQLLLDQIDRAWASPLGKKVMGDRKPASLHEFRSMVPLTTHVDYEPFLNERREDMLACKPAIWCHSSGRMGQFKWFPHSQEFLDRANRACLSIVVLASTRERGAVNIGPGFKFLLMLPPASYMSGSMIDAMAKHVSFRALPPRDSVSQLGFQERVAAGFQL
ncbi:MAG: GH3 auxin-responsive promoter family protein, partial [Dehalococcoidia bacterium]|nr:GH3 auxin-responsive promoter family protein [Dehalococcoidia bacterium]